MKPDWNLFEDVYESRLDAMFENVFPKWERCRDSFRVLHWDTLPMTYRYMVDDVTKKQFMDHLIDNEKFDAFKIVRLLQEIDVAKDWILAYNNVGIGVTVEKQNEASSHQG